jgi:hypothetical protein
MGVIQIPQQSIPFGIIFHLKLDPLLVYLRLFPSLAWIPQLIFPR